MDKTPPEEQQPSPGSAAGREPLDAPGLLKWCISLLAAHAWQSMGLILDPSTNKIARNLGDARLAIDAAGVLVDQVRPRLDDAERREMAALLADLRINFVEQQARTPSAQSTQSSQSAQSTDNPQD